MTYSTKTTVKLALITLVPLALSSCDSVRNTFGLDHYRSDEWSVPNTPPLDLPPDYNLVPPQPGIDPINSVSPSVQAQKNIGAPAAVKSSSEMEKAIVEKGAGDTYTDPNIRAKIDKEAAEEVSALTKLSNLPKKAMDNLMGTGSAAPVPVEKAVPPKAEAAA